MHLTLSIAKLQIRFDKYKNDFWTFVCLLHFVDGAIRGLLCGSRCSVPAKRFASHSRLLMSDSNMICFAFFQSLYLLDAPVVVAHRLPIHHYIPLGHIWAGGANGKQWKIRKSGKMPTFC